MKPTLANSGAWRAFQTALAIHDSSGTGTGITSANATAPINTAANRQLRIPTRIPCTRTDDRTVPNPFHAHAAFATARARAPAAQTAPRLGSDQPQTIADARTAKHVVAPSQRQCASAKPRLDNPT